MSFKKIYYSSFIFTSDFPNYNSQAEVAKQPGAGSEFKSS